MAANKNQKSAAESNWLSWCAERKAVYLPEERERLHSDKMTVFGIAERLSRWADDKVFVPASSGYADKSMYISVDGRQGLALSIFRQPNANVVDVSNRLRKELSTIIKTLPPV